MVIEGDNERMTTEASRLDAKLESTHQGND